MTELLLVLLLAAGVWNHRRLVRRIEALEAAVDGAVAERPAAAAAPPPAMPAMYEPPKSAWSVDEPAEKAAKAEPDTVEAEIVAPAPEPPLEPAGGGGFEALVGGRLPIWVGGAALTVGGYFLVRLAIEAGLLGPWVRIGLALAFGLALVLAAELGRGWAPIGRDPRVAQALSGAGIATLYATSYLASAGYGLIGPVAAFMMMATVTAAALMLSLRHGAPTAVIGLIGGFATPLLAGGAGRGVTLVLLYLALLAGGLFALAVRRGWPWLALASAAGALFWSGWLISAADAGGALQTGVFASAIVAAAVFTPAAGDMRWTLPLRVGPAIIGLLELAALVARVDFGWEGWALYLLLSAGTLWLAAREAAMVPLAVGALVLAALVLAAGADDGSAMAPWAGIAIASLFGGVGLTLAERRADARWTAISVGGLALPWLILRGGMATLLTPVGWGAAALVLAAPPLWLAWRSEGVVRAIGLGAGAVLTGLAVNDLLPPAFLPAGVAAISLALATVVQRTGDRRIAGLVQGAVTVALLSAAIEAGGVIEAILASLFGETALLPMLPAAGQAALVLVLPVPLLGLALWRAVLSGAVDADGGRAPPAPRARGRGDDALWLAVLALLVAGLWVLLKHGFGIVDEAGFVARGFGERALTTQLMFLGGAMLARRAGAARLGQALTIVALARLLVLDLLIFNPALVAQAVGPFPVVNLLAGHFALAGFWTAVLWREAAPEGRTRLLALLVIVLGSGLALATRQAFQGSILSGPEMPRAEFWSYSVAGVALSVALLGWGARLADRPMRIAGLGLLTLTVCKVFLVDAAALEGVLRVLSFLGLGAALIAIGWGYGRFLGTNGAARPLSG